MKKFLALAIAFLFAVSFATPVGASATKHTVNQRTLATFSGNSTQLTNLQKEQIRAAIRTNPGAEKFICTGIRFHSQPMSMNIMVRQRAKAACDYAKQLNPKLSTFFQNKPTQVRSFAGKVLLTVKSPDMRDRANETLMAAEACKPSWKKHSSQGFPRPDGYLPASGEIRAVMLFVEFPRVRITEDIRAEARDYIEEFESFFERVSQGKVRWRFTVPESPFLINRNPADYGMNMLDPNFGNPKVDMYFRDAIAAADSKIDFGEFDVVYVIPPKRIGNTISYGPAFPRLPEGYITSDEGSISAGAVAGNDSRLGQNSLPWQWLAHETGHLFGLEHPYRDNSDQFGRGEGAIAGYGLWDLMGWMRSPSPDFLGWSQYWVGWITDDQVRCVTAGGELRETWHELVPLKSAKAGDRLALVRLDEDRVLVVENRTAMARNSPTRVLVTVMDSRKGDREGQFQIVPANTRTNNGYLDGSLGPGDKVEIEGVTVQLMAQQSGNAIIRIQLSK